MEKALLVCMAPGGVGEGLAKGGECTRPGLLEKRGAIDDVLHMNTWIHERIDYMNACMHAYAHISFFNVIMSISRVPSSFLLWVRPRGVFKKNCCSYGSR